MATPDGFKKVSINLSDDLLLRIDDYSKSLGVNRSSAIIFLLNQGLRENQVISSISPMLNAVEQLKGLSEFKGLSELVRKDEQ